MLKKSKKLTILKDKCFFIQNNTHYGVFYGIGNNKQQKSAFPCFSVHINDPVYKLLQFFSVTPILQLLLPALKIVKPSTGNLNPSYNLFYNNSGCLPYCNRLFFIVCKIKTLVLNIQKKMMKITAL